MDYYNISGYGVDLTVLANAANLTDAEQNLYTKLVHSDTLLDTIDVLASRHSTIVTDTPSNSDAFDYFMNYTPTKVGDFWEHEVVFRMLHVYSRHLTYRTPLFYQG